MRLDLFLKASRLVKRRAIAKEMCESGRVLVNGREAQPAKEVRTGDRIVVRYASKDLEVEVAAIPERPGKAAPETMFRILSETRTRRDDDTW